MVAVDESFIPNMYMNSFDIHESVVLDCEKKKGGWKSEIKLEYCCSNAFVMTVLVKYDMFPKAAIYFTTAVNPFIESFKETFMIA